MIGPQTHESPVAAGLVQSNEAVNFKAKATGAVASTQVDLAQADRFLTLLDEDADRWHFRTIHPTSAAVRNYAGSLDQVAPRLQADNAAGFGIYVTINEGGTTAADITRVRAVFADWDPPKTAAMPSNLPLDPHMIVESSRGKHHAYWLLDGLQTHEFKATQQAIIAAHGSDAEVCDLPRIMRLPGFLHTKGEPYLSQLIHESGTQAYTADTIRTAFKPRQPAPAAPQGEGPRVVDADRHGDALTLTGRLAREVVAGGMSEDVAWLAIVAERDRGRWTRHVDDGELRRLFAGALAKLRGGEWKAPAVPAVADPAAPRPAILRLTRLGKIQSGPIEWLIEDYLVKETAAGIIGPSGGGKSFVAVDMAACIATGTPWHGRPVSQGVVFYLAGEGQRGLRMRFDGWAKEHGVAIDDAPVYVSGGLASLCEPDQLAISVDEMAEAAAAENQKPALIIIDTLARAMGGRNENSAEDMGAFIAAKDLLKARFGCTVLSIHHTGHDKDTQGRGRGSSARYGALDSEFLVAGGEKTITLTGTKEKDWDKPRPITFDKVPVNVDVVGADGSPEQSGTLALRDKVGAILDSNKRQKAIELAEAGQSVRTIAVQLGVSKSSVAVWLKAPQAA
ncbi:AAA family ATPase [Luteimonas sp. MJ250]|uniref:AAA family ATPase n=1 Tax=Luteimonas sp. MJ250 TaxID=3129236 RepID=UPI0031BAB11D